MKKGDVLITILAKSETDAQAAAKRLATGIQWSDKPIEPLPLFYATKS